MHALFSAREEGGSVSGARFNLNDYATVAERITAFWAKHPEGRIHTTLVEYAADHVVMRAEIFSDREDARPVATDYAEEIRTERGVNSSSMVENCSTSAIGRALANYGMSLSKARPSREEMQKVQRMEQASRPAPHSAPARQDAPRPLRPAEPAAALPVTAEQITAVEDTLTQQHERETPEGALAWLASAPNRTEMHEAHRRVRAFVEQGILDKAQMATAYNESDTRLRAATA